MQHSPWHEAIKSHLPEGYFHQINDFMNEVYSKGVVYPPRDKVFKALQTTEMDQVKVLILGQDPYHGPDQAQGLSFSVPDHVPAPPSLQNILKELRSDIGEKRSHDLTSWAEQGVLLLNACLTVPAGQANGHELEEPVVFILWGSYARKKKPLITHDRHLVLESAHPSPLSAYRGFFGSQPFSKTNEFLKEAGREPIDWLR